MRRATTTTTAGSRPKVVALVLIALLAVYFAAATLVTRPPVVDNDNNDNAKSSPTLVLETPPSRREYITCETSKGSFTIQLDHLAAPNSARQLLRMVDAGYFNTRIPFFRVNRDITQFGVRQRGLQAGRVSVDWERDLHHETQRDKRVPWKRGVVAMIGGPQMVIVKRDSKVMGKNNHDTVVGWIDEQGMQTIDALYAYNDVIDHPKGGGPDQTQVHLHGWDYLNRDYPLVDYIKSCE